MIQSNAKVDRNKMYHDLYRWPNEFQYKIRYARITTYLLPAGIRTRDMKSAAGASYETT